MSIKELMNQYPGAGTIEWIGVRPGLKLPVISQAGVTLTVEAGIEGDHYAGRSGKRQVTLIQAEHLYVLRSIMNKDVSPELLRRNIMIRGLNLLSLKDKRFKLGDAILEYTGLCHPCSRMESVLGKGGYNAMRGHGGITAKVVEGGHVSINDKLSIL